MASPPLIQTERQALIALANQFRVLGEATSDLDIDATLTAALAVVAGALVVGGRAAYREGTLSAMTLAPTGELRVQTADPEIEWFGPNPFEGEVSWGGTS